MTTSVAITPYLNYHRLLGTRTAMDTGTSPATLAIYGSARVGPLEAPTTAPLAVLNLTNPSGTVDIDDGYIITADGFAMITLTGDAVWGRFTSRNGNTIMDMNCRAVDDPPEIIGEIVLPRRTLYAGGTTTLVSCIIN